jgi:hypothetical protein
MKIELSHDLLAKKIHEKASQEDKMLLRIRKFIQDRFTYFNESKALLSVKDINYITPYLEKLSLEAHERRFIRRSKDRIWIIALSIVFVVFSILGIIFYFINQTNKVELKSRERMAAQLARYEEISQHAEELTEALTESREGLDATKEDLRMALLALQERNDTLVHSYATYKVQQGFSKEQLQKSLKIAQSAKLSELAAPLVSLDKGYAFRLAAQAWNLNPENHQAMQVLYRVAGLKVPDTPSKQQASNIIKKYKPRWGGLSSKEMEAIFHPENKVTAQEDIAQQVKKRVKSSPPPPSSSMPTPKEIDDKIKAQRTQIQQSVEKINLRQQQIRNQIKDPE